MTTYEDIVRVVEQFIAISGRLDKASVANATGDHACDDPDRAELRQLGIAVCAACAGMGLGPESETRRAIGRYSVFPNPLQGEAARAAAADVLIEAEVRRTSALAGSIESVEDSRVGRDTGSAPWLIEPPRIDRAGTDASIVPGLLNDFQHEFNSIREISEHAYPVCFDALTSDAARDRVGALFNERNIRKQRLQVIGREILGFARTGGLSVANLANFLECFPHNVLAYEMVEHDIKRIRFLANYANGEKTITSSQTVVPALPAPTQSTQATISLFDQSAKNKTIVAPRRLLPDAFSANEEFTNVRFPNPTTYTFSPAQGKCIAILYKAWKDGPDGVHQSKIGRAVGSNGDRFRLRDTFRMRDKKTRALAMHPAWGTMIKPGASRGIFVIWPPCSHFVPTSPQESP